MHIVKPNLAKRSGAALLDFVILYLLISLMRYFAIYPIYDALYDLQGLEQSLNALAYDSKLYIEDAEQNAPVKVVADDIPATIYAYYSEFKDGKIYKDETTAFDFSNEWYNQTILNIGSTATGVTIYFEYDVDGLGNPDPSLVGIPLATTTDEQLTTFYAAAYQTAQDDLLEYPRLIELNQEGARYDLEMTLISLGFNLIVLHFIIPIILKNGQTIGKKAFSLAVVSKDGYRLKFWQHAIRFIAFGIETVFGIYTLFVGYLIPYTFLLFTKKNQAPHDFAAQTMIADLKSSLIFVDEQEAQDYDAKVMDTTLAIETKRKQIVDEAVVTDLPKENEKE